MLKTLKILACSLLLLLGHTVHSQNSLQSKFEHIADNITGKLGVSALHIASGEAVSFNGHERFPMQSVYKFPIAMVVLHEVDKGRFTLEDTVAITREDYIPKAGHSPLRDTYPNGVKLPLKKILAYNIAKSDGTACDVLLRLLGGTDYVQESMYQLEIQHISIATTEGVQVAHDTVQYQNWATPIAMNTLLKVFHEGQYLSESSKEFLWSLMSVSTPWFDRRIKRLLPAGTPVAHKTGTAGTYNGLTRATNDVGIMTLPDGSHVALSVFIADSYDSQEKREITIARAAKAAYIYFSQENE